MNLDVFSSCVVYMNPVSIIAVKWGIELIYQREWYSFSKSGLKKMLKGMGKSKHLSGLKVRVITEVWSSGIMVKPLNNKDMIECLEQKFHSYNLKSVPFYAAVNSKALLRYPPTYRTELARKFIKEIVYNELTQKVER